MPHGPHADALNHRTSSARLAEFREQRLGLFIHWGLYALAARHEWVKQREHLTDADYQPYFDHFDPDLFDPDAWAEAAAGAGMRYMVLTTKHHDGFCLWDSALTDYSVAGTPYGKDLVGPIVAAFRARGLGVGFYHSLLDWHHPDFPIDGLHPLHGRVEEPWRDIAKYRRYLHGQVEELLTRYGRIDTMWFDFSYSTRLRDGKPTPGGKGAADWRSAELMRLVRELQPGILVNNRLEIPGDFVTPEQFQPPAPPGEVWEACQTLNGSWGYDRDNLDYKPVDLLVRMLVDTVSKDGNLLLNVGPDGRGAFDPRALETLRGIGEWMRLHGRAVYGAGPSAFEAPQDCRYTQRGDRLYVHLLAWPYRHLHLPGLAGRVRYAQLLNDGSEIRRLVPDPARDSGHTKLGALPPGTLTLQLPVQRPDVAVPVIELFL
ncbi:alpha-L-fucosidase [Nonomuraea africana]|uniref:alpha-L-fucosidase n=1 Tax=Nonomuraea africana TaxID=46171 RepID=A0ABR9KHS1_9ACTN|nr:alpha-L-fucosidase [Nonomuraea africana]MBE1561505.1 alpha-L-fucosidase [Nonomuraea africana]